METPTGQNSSENQGIGQGTLVDGRYEVGPCVGVGSRSSVYLCSLVSEGSSEFVLKVLHADAQEEDVAKFQKESNSLLGIQHPHILRCHEQIEFEGQQVLVLDYAGGGTLKDYLAQHAPLPIEDAVRVAAEICSGLEFFHQVGIVHRDLKQRNIFLSADLSVRIGDLGLCKFPGEEEAVRVGSVIGAIDYVSPEYVQSGTLDHRADLYAVSILLYEMLSAEYPFSRESDPVKSLMKRLTSDPIPLENFRPDCPREVREIILRGLMRDPANRYQSAAEMEEALRAADTRAAPVAPPAEESLSASDALPKQSLTGGKLTQAPISSMRTDIYDSDKGTANRLASGVNSQQKQQMTKIAALVCALLVLGGIVLMLMPGEGANDAPPLIEENVAEVEEENTEDSASVEAVESEPAAEEDLSPVLAEGSDQVQSLDDAEAEVEPESESEVEVEAESEVELEAEAVPSEDDIKSILGDIVDKANEEAIVNEAEDSGQDAIPSAPKPISIGNAKRKIDLSQKGGMVALYRVKPGDSLGRIAKKFGASVQRIVSENGIANPAKLKVGTTLRIPKE